MKVIPISELNGRGLDSRADHDCFQLHCFRAFLTDPTDFKKERQTENEEEKVYGMFAKPKPVHIPRDQRHK